jgi:NAD(P)H-hydrate epimerase
MSDFSVVVDALFGFSFKGPIREPYKAVISALASSTTPVLAVDVPSGWDIENGDVYKTLYVPEAVISLTVPKLCLKTYSGVHFIGGR